MRSTVEGLASMLSAGMDINHALLAVAHHGPLHFRRAIENIAHADPARPSSLRRDIDGEVETIVLHALAKEKQRRYQSAEALARDIDERYRTAAAFAVDLRDWLRAHATTASSQNVLEALLDLILERAFEHLNPEHGAIFLRMESGAFERAAGCFTPSQIS